MTLVAEKSEHWPGPMPDDAPFTRYCLACGQMWPCSDRLVAIVVPPPLPRRDLEPGEEALLLRIGMYWHVEGVDGTRYHQRSGGTVVGYDDDEDDRRTYRVLRWHQGRPLTVGLPSADVEPAGCHEGDACTLADHAVALAEYVGTRPGTAAERLEWLRMATGCMERAV